ncbi:hypothetical protein K0A97_01480 [Patescibacteria group bacterium]|nr:hypothetical protein [Patescibacteria group bacterium]
MIEIKSENKKDHVWSIKKNLALNEIIILILSIIAFSYLVGESLPVVSGSAGTPSSTLGTEDFTKAITEVINESIEESKTNLAKETLAMSKPFVRTEKIIPPTKLQQVSTISPPSPASSGGIFKSIWTELTKSLKFSDGVAAVFNTATAASGVAFLLSFIVETLIVGITTGDWSRALESGVRVGSGAATGAFLGYMIAGLVGGPAGLIAAGVSAIGIWLFNKYLKRDSERQVSFLCKPWQAQIGGEEDCSRCNDQLFPCTEYQCKSFGTACQLINKDTSEPRCVWIADRDINPPRITPLSDSLTEGYNYEPLTPALGSGGVEITYQESTDGCLPAFQPFSFGIELDREGYCRIEFERTGSFEEMKFDFGGKNLYQKEHTQQMTFPGVVHLEEAIQQNALNITVDSNIEMYVRCMSVNGIKNVEEFLFKFCIDKGPDTTAPIIKGFNWRDEAPIAYFKEGDTREVDVQVYVNEPSECKWDWEDKDYSNMNNELDCQSSMVNFNAQLTYVCSGKLTGLENNQENDFYFRCKDQPNSPEENRNVNIESKKLTLIGTQPLYINSASPDSITIKGSTDVIKVTLEAITSAGYREGESTCLYSNTGNQGSYVLFSQTDSHSHSTNVYLEEGDYDFFIRCIDSAGNSDTKEISFEVETDTYSPRIVRVYWETSNLKIVTNEEAECVYSNLDCQYLFEDGISISSEVNKILHTLPWNPSETFYIKCKDQFDNKPYPNQCSIVLRPFSV